MKLNYTNKIIIIVLFLLSFTTLNAQTKDSLLIDKNIDSAYNSKNDSTRAFNLVNQAINDATLINYQSGIAAATQLKGYLFYEYGDYKNAKKFLYEAYELNKVIKNDKVMAQNLRLLAIYLEGNNQFNEALEFLYQSLNIRKRLHDEKGIAECYISIGIIHHRSHHIQVAVSYYKKALAYFTKVKNVKTTGAINSNLGAAYNQLGKLDSALIFLKEVVYIKQKLKDNIGLGKAYHNLATTYSFLGEFQKSVDYYNLAIKYTGGGENNSNNGISYEAAGAILIRMNKFDEAEKYLRICENIYKKNELLDLLVNCYEKIALLYETKGDFKTAVIYNTLASSLADSIQIIADQNSFAEIEAKYKAIEKTTENELLLAKNKILEQESVQNKILILCLVLVIVVSVILAFNLRTVKNTKNKLEIKNKEVAIQNEKLEDLIEENQSLMGILAHDLRSPFVKISGLINLIEENNETEEEKVVYINYIHNICKDSLQLIKDTIDLSGIFHEKNSNSIDKKELFAPSEILNQVMNSYKAIAAEKGIEINISDALHDKQILNSKEYLIRILDNLLGNAIKFSPPKSTIYFSTYSAHNLAVFSVKDQGPGLTDADKKQLFMRFKKLSARPTGNEASSGLGLYIVKVLVELINGKINVISEVGKGAEFILEVPMQTT